MCAFDFMDLHIIFGLVEQRLREPFKLIREKNVHLMNVNCTIDWEVFNRDRPTCIFGVSLLSRLESLFA